MRRFVLGVVLFFFAFIALLAQGDKYSADYLKYVRLINQWSNATPESAGISQQEYDRLLAKLHLVAADKLYLMTELEEALQMYQTAIEYCEKSECRETLLMALDMAANLNYYLDNVKQSFDDSEKALKIAMEINDTSTFVDVSLSYCKRLEEQNVRSRALELSEVIASIDKESLSNTSRVSVLRCLIESACKKGDFDMADLYLEEYADFIAPIKDDAYNSVKCIYLSTRQGRLNAEGLNEEAAACAIEQAECSVTDEDKLMAYGNAMHYFALAGDKENFIHYVDTVSTMMSSIPVSMTEIGMLHNMKAMSYRNLGMYEEALQEYEKLASIGYDDTYVDVLKGNVLHAMGRNDEARLCYESYAERCLNQYGVQSLQYADALRYLANIAGFCGDLEAGFGYYENYLGLARQLIKSELPYLKPADKDKFWFQMAEGVMHMASYSLKAGYDQSSFTRMSYDGLLFAKGLLLSSDRSVADYIRLNADDRVRDIYYETLNLKGKLEKLKNDYVTNKDSILFFSSQLNRLETLLATECSVYGDQTTFMDVGYDDIRRGMNKKSVVVDFVDYESDEVGRRYIAYVYRKDWSAPKLIQVFTQDDLDALGISEAHPEQLYSRKYSSKILHLIWDPISKYVDEGDKVFFVPSGNMHMIALESLPLDNEYHLGDRYNIVRLSSAREIVSGRLKKMKPKTASLFGGLRFDAGSVGSTRSAFADLPMSGEEVDAVAELLRDARVQSDLYKGLDGTVEAFAGQTDPSPDILHFATHGFYYEPGQKAGLTALAGYKNAMMRSGLAMSGGLMTAEEISRMDFSDTDLVVLTACDTGKGKITPEGVYGLQRAFKKAGAQTIIMSLWKTDDTAAKDFILSFYKEMKSGGWDKHKAFEAARAEMRAKYRSPYYWGGFIMLD